MTSIGCNIAEPKLPLILVSLSLRNYLFMRVMMFNTFALSSRCMGIGRPVVSHLGMFHSNIPNLDDGKQVLGEEHLHTLLSLDNLVLTYSNQRRWKEAE